MHPQSEAFLVVLADQPGIGADLIDRLIRGFRQADSRRGIARPVFRGLPGHPVLIGARYLQAALQLQGHEGARRILANHPADILEIEVDREAVSLVGGGGKTALMYALGRELSADGRGVILTTTTKIREPATSPFFVPFLSRDLDEIRKWVAENIRHSPCLLIAGERLPGGKLDGIPPGWVEALLRTEKVSVIVNEADGAAGRPLKAPREGEPVVPESTTLLAPVIGIDGLGRPLDEARVFRSAIASRRAHRSGRQQNGSPRRPGEGPVAGPVSAFRRPVADPGGSPPPLDEGRVLNSMVDGFCELCKTTTGSS